MERLDLCHREGNIPSQGFLPGELVLAWHSGPPRAGSPAAGGRRLGSRPGAVSFLCKSIAVSGGLSLQLPAVLPTPSPQASKELWGLE